MFAQQFILKRIPQGLLSGDDIELTQETLPALRQGDIKVKTLPGGVDPGFRMRLSGVTIYSARLPLGSPLAVTPCTGLPVEDKPLPKRKFPTAERKTRGAFARIEASGEVGETPRLK